MLAKQSIMARLFACFASITEMCITGYFTTYALTYYITAAILKITSEVKLSCFAAPEITKEKPKPAPKKGTAFFHKNKAIKVPGFK